MKNLGLWQFAGFVIATALGTILHFLFDWTGSLAVAPFSAVNESTWEHMKILFFPLLVFAMVQYQFFRVDFAGFWWVKLIGTAVGVVGIPVLFYTFNGAFFATPDWLNVAFFFLASALGFLVEYLLFRANFSLAFEWIAFAVILAVGVLFCTFTFLTPRLPLFQDPITGSFGVG